MQVDQQDFNKLIQPTFFLTEQQINDQLVYEVREYQDLSQQNLGTLLKILLSRFWIEGVYLYVLSQKQLLQDFKGFVVREQQNDNFSYPNPYYAHTISIAGVVYHFIRVVHAADNLLRASYYVQYLLLKFYQVLRAQYVFCGCNTSVLRASFLNLS